MTLQLPSRPFGLLCRPALWTALLALASCFAPAQSAVPAAVSASVPVEAAQEQLPPPPPLHVDVHLINVFVNVTDANGAPVAGLVRENFALAEDGRPQKISFFERESAMPLTIILALDTSGSVKKDLPVEQEAAHKFVHAMMRPIDQFALMDFSSDVREVVPFTNKASRIDGGLQNLRGGPATALYDAVYLASQTLMLHSGRKVLLLVTDGDNTVDGVDFARAMEQAVRSEVMVYSIIDVPIAADAGRDTGGEHALITLSQETGGKYYYAEADELTRAFEKVADDLRTQYSLGYYPSKQPRGVDFHSISVAIQGQATGQPFNVRHRTGYYSSPAQ